MLSRIRRSLSATTLLVVSTLTFGALAVPAVAAEPEGASISGVVTHDGVPVAEVLVLAHSQVGGESYGATTDDAGRYVVPGLVVGDPYTVEFDAPLGFRDEFYDDASRYWDATAVLAGSTGIDADLAACATISGTVTDSAGVAADGVRVLAEAVDEAVDSAGFTTTGPDGRYTLTGLATGTDHRVQFESSDTLMGEYYDDVANYSSARPVPAGATGIDAQLAPAAVITGTVTDEAGLPAADVDVWAVDVVDDTMDYYATTDEDGRYSLKGLAVGAQYVVRFTRSDYVRAYYPGAIAKADASPVTAGATDVDHQLARGLRITGTVTDANGAPVVDTEVSARTVGGDSSSFAWTDAEGAYSLGGLPEGSQHIVHFFGASGLLDEYYDDVHDRTLATPVTAGATDIDAQLTPGETISGTLTLQGGLPAAGVDVYAQAEEADSYGHSTTAPDGTYTVTGLLPGAEYVVRFDGGAEAVSEYYDDAATWRAAARVPAGSTGVDAELLRAQAITGRVTDEHGAPVSELEVYASPLSNNDTGDLQTFTRADGTYTLGGLTPGASYVVQFQGDSNLVAEYYDDAATRSEAAPVVAGSDGIDAVLSPAGTISGAVRAAGGIPVRYAEVIAHRTDVEGARQAYASTDSLGRYTLTGLPLGGTYVIEFEGTTGLLGEFYNNTRDRSQATAVPTGATGIDAELAPSASITGTVSGADGTIPEELRVEAYAAGQPDEALARGWTDETGAYTIPGLEPGTSYVLHFSGQDGLLGEFYDDAATFAEADSVPAGATGVDAVLAVGSTITGVVTDEQGAGLADILVDAFGLNGGGAGHDAYAYTDENGAYTLTGLLPNTDFEVKFGSTATHVGEYYDDARFSGDAVPVRSGSTGIDAVLSPGASISGRVTTEQGIPIEWADITAVPVDDSLPWRSAYTDEDGRYTVIGLPAGAEYRLQFEHYDGYVGEFYDGATTIEDARPVRAGATGIDVALASTRTPPKQPTTTSLSVSSAAVNAGQSVTAVATVPDGATGTVLFREGDSVLGESTIGAGVATLTIPTEAVGTRTITATYTGSAKHHASTSPPVSFTVQARVTPPPPAAPPVAPPVAPPAPPVAAPPVKTVVTLSTPAFSKTTQVYGHKQVATLTTTVKGATTGTVTFRNGSTTLGSATIGGGKASLKLSKSLKPGSYKAVTATYGGTSTTTAATSPQAKTFTVAKTKLAKKATVTGKAFKKNAKPTITVTLGKLTNGTYATGKVKIYVGKKVIKTVTITAKHKGKIAVTLPKRYRSTIKLKAAYQSTSTITGSTSKVTAVKAR